MAGLAGLTFRSTTGARLKLIPTSASVVAINVAYSVAAVSSPVAPTSAWDATAGKPASRRQPGHPPPPVVLESRHNYSFK